MHAKIIKYPGYPLGALEFPNSVRYVDGKTFVRADGVIYHTTARINGMYPIRHVVEPSHPEYRAALNAFAIPASLPPQLGIKRERAPFWREVAEA
jgi:hypothetical protein